ncbi:hypothetical protein BS50DRAFT_322786 [Corynespora cassiicola Philippines]|uniref:Uncharacterized protein n=1 Tax=Corynespora cassiicola Philippines TaxID=1448308 RepID=A0A2T2NTI2_CORCC|nr:hypothetical protein BS50DRAFT_322786 [Corynespora cassiicola Philippines]
MEVGSMGPGRQREHDRAEPGHGGNEAVVKRSESGCRARTVIPRRLFSRDSGWPELGWQFQPVPAGRRTGIGAKDSPGPLWPPLVESMSWACSTLRCQHLSCSERSAACTAIVLDFDWLPTKQVQCSYRSSIYPSRVQGLFSLPLFFPFALVQTESMSKQATKMGRNRLLPGFHVGPRFSLAVGSSSSSSSSVCGLRAQTTFFFLSSRSAAQRQSLLWQGHPRLAGRQVGR